MLEQSVSLTDFNQLGRTPTIQQWTIAIWTHTRQLGLVRADEHGNGKRDSLDQDDEDKHQFPQSQPVVCGPILILRSRTLF